MSASAKKKLRKEHVAAQLTEKQLKEQKEVKKLKAYTTVFVAAIAVILVAALAIAGFNFYNNSGIKQKNTIAAVVGDHKINSVEMNYYYTDIIDSNYNNWYSSYGDSMSLYLSLMGLDLTTSLDEQQFSEDTTWADYFLDLALSNAQSDYTLADKAAAEGFAISEASKTSLEQTFESLSMYATLYGYEDVDSYLHAVYGPGSTEESYRAYAERSALASDYYNAYSESIEIDDAAIRAYEADKYDNYSSFSYASYTLSYSYFLSGGTTDEEGNVTYSEEEKDAARNAAKAAAESLPQCSTAEELNAALATLGMNEDVSAECTVSENILLTNANSSVREWLADSSRQNGDFTYVANETTSTDENGVESTVVNSYTAYVYLGREDNNMPLANIRQILVNFECTETSEHDHDSYTDQEKAAALAEAESILDQFLATDQSEDSFAALATELTDDTATAATGGLYEDITPAQGVYVESFTDWATDPAREAGDTGIIESTYGYHIMYYVGDDELTYRDSLIKEELLSNTITEWYSEILAVNEAALQNTSCIKKDIVLSK